MNCIWSSTGIMRWSRYNSRGGIKKSKGWLGMPGIFVNTWRVFCWISQGCFAGWAAALIWVTSIRQGRVARSVLTAGRASKISCGGRRAAALWSESDCTWDAPLRPAGLLNGTCGDTRACLALRNSWRNVIGGNRSVFSVGEVGCVRLMESQEAVLRDSYRSMVKLCRLWHLEATDVWV